MKKIFLLFITILMAAAAYAQRAPYIGDVIIKASKIERRSGTVYVELNVDVDAVAMNKMQSWTIIPEFTTADGRETLSLPYILINGKNKRQLYERKLRFENTELLSDMPYMLVNVNKNTDTTFRYIIEVPYYPWMDNADLSVRQILTSCREKEQLFLFTIDNYFDRAPRMAYRPQPQVCFIMPDGSQQESAVIHYHLDRTDIDPNYMDNPQQLAKIRRMSEKASKSSATLYVDGFASPEGPYRHNDWLSQERAKRLKDYISQTFGIQETRFSTRTVAEDWQMLRPLVESSGISMKSDMLAIIDSGETYERKEQRMKALGGGRPYQEMLAELLPVLRRAEYRVEFSLADYSDDEFAAMLRKQPEELSQREIYLMAQSYPLDTEEFNSLFNQMVSRYQDDPTCHHNAAAFLLVRGDCHGAKKYMERGKETPQMYNNMGIYYMQIDELEKAEEMLRKAYERGVPEARHNLAELERMKEENRYL